MSSQSNFVCKLIILFYEVPVNQMSRFSSLRTCRFKPETVPACDCKSNRTNISYPLSLHIMFCHSEPDPYQRYITTDWPNRFSAHPVQRKKQP